LQRLEDDDLERAIRESEQERAIILSQQDIQQDSLQRAINEGLEHAAALDWMRRMGEIPAPGRDAIKRHEDIPADVMEEFPENLFGDAAPNIKRSGFCNSLFKKSGGKRAQSIGRSMMAHLRRQSKRAPPV